MAIAKRIFLFLLVNILVVVTISIVTQVLGIQPYLQARGIAYDQLAYFCLVWGFGGAFISLALSRVMAKWMMGVKLVDMRTQDAEARWLLERVQELSRSAGLSAMPEVGIYESPELNAFATGPTRSRALVAVSSGLLRRMSHNEIEGVLAHEIAHVANGDMVTMTLLQGVVNAFVMFLARVIAFALSQNVKEESRHMVRFFTTFVLEIALSLLGAMVVAYFSRHREFRADAGGARFAGRDKMIAALGALRKNYGMSQHEEADASSPVQAFKISGKSGGLMALLSTHPPLEVRIQRLESATNL